MKTRTTAAKCVMTQYKDGFRIGIILIALIGLAMASCSDDEKATEPDTRQQFVGNYSVEDISASSGYKYEYSVNITMGSKGGLEISNFGDVMNVPVKATAKGNQIVIESQTFKNPSGKTITVMGSGTIANDVLTFNYSITGYRDYQGACKAERNK